MKLAELAAEERELVRAACDKVKANPVRLLDCMVGSDRVVIVISTGQKYVFPLSELPVVDSLGGVPPVTFEGLLAPRVVVILQEADLLDPEVLQKKTDDELEATPGIGPRTVKLLREALEAYGEQRRQPGLL